MQYVQTYCVECIDVHTYVLMYVFNVLYCRLCEFVNLSEVSVCCCLSIAHALCAALGGLLCLLATCGSFSIMQY